MNVLSLFDGISCGQIALQRSCIDVGVYYASEINKYAIAVAQHNYPDTVQLGDVTKISANDLPYIDLLIGGSPCQGFSTSGKKQGFDDPRSKLFFEFVRLRNKLNPTYWMLENVSLKKEYVDIINYHLGVSPVKINSSLLSAQNRKRLYWANFEISQPQNSEINLVDILDLDGKELRKAFIVSRRLNEHGKRDDYNKSIPYTHCLEVNEGNKSNCLTTFEKDNVLTSMPLGRHRDAFKRKLPFRYYTLNEYCKLQTVPEDYFSGVVLQSQAKRLLGNGWTVDVIAHIFNCMQKSI